VRRYKTRKHKDCGLDNYYLALPSLNIGKDLILPFHIEALQCLFVLGRDVVVLKCWYWDAFCWFFDLLLLKMQGERW